MESRTPKKKAKLKKSGGQKELNIYMPELEGSAQLALDTLELISNEIDIAPAEKIFTWSSSVPEDHMGLVLTGNTKRARIGNLYTGIEGDFRLHNTLGQMAARSRSMIEARLEYSPEKRAIAMVLKACEAPVLPYDARSWGVITARWSVSVKGLLGPTGPEGVLESVLDEYNVTKVSARKADIQTVHHTGNRELEVTEPMDRGEALQEIRRIILNSGEVDWYNLAIPENQS